MDREIWKYPEIIHHYLTSAIVYYLTGRRDYWKLIRAQFFSNEHLIKTPATVRITDRIKIRVYYDGMWWRSKAYSISYYLIIDNQYVRDYTGTLCMVEWKSNYLLWEVEINRKPQSRLQPISRADAVLINRWSWDVRNADSYDLSLIRLGVGPYIRYSKY